MNSLRIRKTESKAPSLCRFVPRIDQEDSALHLELRRSNSRRTQAHCKSYGGYPDYHFDYHTGEEWIAVSKQTGNPDAIEAMFFANRDWLMHANGGSYEYISKPAFLKLGPTTLVSSYAKPRFYRPVLGKFLPRC